jgi:HipA-like protein
MRWAEVYKNGELAGMLKEVDQHHFIFTYSDAWFVDPEKPAVSLTLSKTQKEYHSEILFPFFFNMLSEGVNRKLQCRVLRIDEKDHFGLLIATAQDDTVGSITIKPVEQ